MNFATAAFFVYLIIVLIGYHGLRARTWKYRFLLLASWFFYMSWSPWYIGVLLFTTVVDYYSGLLIERAATDRARRGWLLASILSNLGFLAFFKYTTFFAENGIAIARWFNWDVPDWPWEIILPLGISFHTFQGISYTIDVYRKKLPAVTSFTDFALFVAFFPQLVAGPIVRAVEFLPQMKEPPKVTGDHIVEGLHWFLLGLFKKVFIADRLATFVDPVFANPEAYAPATHLWAAFAYAGQIYCDFSGYSDLATGCAKWFGFELPLNFDFPYLSTSIADFWRRWHVSLSTWLRDYVYFSMGGNRQGNVRTYVNLLATMGLCGLWHGASFHYILWGFYNGILLMLHRLWDHWWSRQPGEGTFRKHPLYVFAAWLCTLWMVVVGFVMIRTPTWADFALICQSLFGLGAEVAGARSFVPNWVPLLVGLVLAGHLFSGLRQMRCGFLPWPSVPRVAVYVLIVALVVIFAPADTKPFIYFQF
jgi:alginate O-acetyltransferase complex protein AlgI